MTLSPATQCNDSGNTCVELIHRLPHTRASGQHSSFHPGRKRPWNQLNCELLLLVLLTQRHTCWQKNMVHPANWALFLPVHRGRIACHLSQGISCNFFRPERFPEVSLLFNFQIPCHAQGKVPIPKEKACLRVQGFSWAEIHSLSRP